MRLYVNNALPGRTTWEEKGGKEKGERVGRLGREEGKEGREERRVKGGVSLCLISRYMRGYRGEWR